MIKAVFFDLGDTLVDEDNFEALPYAHEVLQGLKEQRYKLAVICDTEASKEEVKAIMEKAGIFKYFDMVVVSSEVGVTKPDEKIFRVALDKLGLQSSEVVMVGNRISRDILGGNQLGMWTILIKWNSRYQEPITNPLEKPNFTIKTLVELIPILNELG
ncbi:MAG: HAD-IIIA family hydrolase [Candidatus Bathyarchaeia archaeon]